MGVRKRQQEGNKTPTMHDICNLQQKNKTRAPGRMHQGNTKVPTASRAATARVMDCADDKAAPTLDTWAGTGGVGAAVVIGLVGEGEGRADGPAVEKKDALLAGAEGDSGDEGTDEAPAGPQPPSEVQAWPAGQ